MNRRVPNGTHGGVGGRMSPLDSSSYPIRKKQSSENQLCCPLYSLEGLMARKSRYREYLNAVRNVKVLSKAPQRRTTHEPIRKRLKELKQAEKAEKQGGGSNCVFWFIDIRSAKPSSSACISGAQPDRPRSVLGGGGSPQRATLPTWYK